MQCIRLVDSQPRYVSLSPFSRTLSIYPLLDPTYIAFVVNHKPSHDRQGSLFIFIIVLDLHIASVDRARKLPTMLHADALLRRGDANCTAGLKMKCLPLKMRIDGPRPVRMVRFRTSFRKYHDTYP